MNINRIAVLALVLMTVVTPLSLTAGLIPLISPELVLKIDDINFALRGYAGDPIMTKEAKYWVKTLKGYPMTLQTLFESLGAAAGMCDYFALRPTVSQETELLRADATTMRSREFLLNLLAARRLHQFYVAAQGMFREQARP
jgi:hypothetical protein